MIEPQPRRDKALFGQSRNEEKDRGTGFDPPKSKVIPQEWRSYADVVKEVKTRVPKVRTEKVNGTISMSWSGSKEVEEWLARSAIEVLKKFDSVESVNQKLDARGFIYSSSYFGGKRIVWSMGSNLNLGLETEKIDFLRMTEDSEESSGVDSGSYTNRWVEKEDVLCYDGETKKKRGVASLMIKKRDDRDVCNKEPKTDWK
ncbi:hypothetical protein LWI28_010090 [Acer negundo]|uniref:Uncharacterized protein n=1 Tax=Acer negundo TaxID=4023 RepID=A0AAD5NXQ7_ACENE|nr:hypothetical protein LWI28_010090 [Acer negundo]